jgi:hypothetical protein
MFVAGIFWPLAFLLLAIYALVAFISLAAD